MDSLERKMHKSREETLNSIDELVKKALEDSETFQEAIKKLKQFQWNFVGSLSEAIIETAIDKINQIALNSQIKKDH